jgi:Flp pilus assembly pilin Flp
MTHRMFKFLRRFRKDEDGQIMVEFAIMVPILFTIFLTSVELGVYSMRQMWLDRGLDMTVRLVRLGTGTTPTHDDLKDMICERAGFIPDCAANLKLEMRSVDPRNFVALAGQADCTDKSLPVLPENDPVYLPGQEHDLMVLRACVKFDPVFPTTGLGFHYEKDGSGQASLIAISAFVQEPGA